MKNCTVIESPNLLVCFSYNVPVAYFNKVTNKAFRTRTIHSNTTSKHINLFFREYIIAKGRYVNIFNFTPYAIDQNELDKKFPLSINVMK